jgi:long-chain fatty acid transport protein
MKSAHFFLLAGACALLPSTAFSLGIRIADQDARGTARGNAFAATADNPSAIYYNPAGITQLYRRIDSVTTISLGGKNVVSKNPVSSPEWETGARTRFGVYGITLEDRVSPASGGPDFDLKRDEQFAPTFYATWKPSQAPIVFGLGLYAPYGFGLEYPEDSPLRTLAISGSVQYLSINPVIAWQVSDTFSIAAGPTFNYGKANLKRGIFAPHDMFQFDGDGWSVGYNAGIMWKPAEKHSFGVTYRSQTDVEFDGHAHTFFNDQHFPTPFGVFTVPGQDHRERATAGIKFPQNIVAGYSFRPTPKWNLEVNVDWTDWDNLNTVYLRKSSGDIALPFNWESSFFYEFGASYKFDNGLVASIGYIYSENSVPNESFNPVVPDSNRHIFSAGLGGQWERWAFDLAYQWAHGPSRTIAQGTVADGTYRFDSHALSLSVGYKF